MKRILLIIGILSIIVLPRIIFLMQYPPMIVDEPANIRDIQRLLSPNSPTFFDFEWGFGQAMLVHYPSVILIKLGITDPYLALRLTSVILSVLALIPFFFLVKREIDSKIALLTTILFSTSFFFLQFSRVGWTNMLSLTLGLYVLWCMSIAMQRTSYVWMGITGCLMGILLYTYRAGEIYIFAACLLWFLMFIRSKKPLRMLYLFVLCISVAYIVASPWIKQIVTYDEKYTLRSRVVSVWNAELPYHGFTQKQDILIYQITTTIKTWMLFLPEKNRDIEANRYLPLPYPMIAYPLIPFFWLGLYLIIRKSTRWIMWMSIYTLGLFFGQILTVHPPNGSRGLIILPVIYVCIGFGLSQFRTWIDACTPSIKQVLYIFVLSEIVLDIIIYIHWMTWIQV